MGSMLIQSLKIGRSGVASLAKNTERARLGATGDTWVVDLVDPGDAFLREVGGGRLLLLQWESSCGRWEGYARIGIRRRAPQDSNSTLHVWLEGTEPIRSRDAGNQLMFKARLQVKNARRHPR